MMNKRKNGNCHRDELDGVVQSLTQIIEKEVKAFQSLLHILFSQPSSSTISTVDYEVNRIVAQTRQLEEERCGKSKDISRYLDIKEPLTFSQLIPLVEQRYAKRLGELKEVLLVLSDKFKNTQRENRDYLENTLSFVNRSLDSIVGSRNRSERVPSNVV